MPVLMRTITEYAMQCNQCGKTSDWQKYEPMSLRDDWLFRGKAIDKNLIFCSGECQKQFAIDWYRLARQWGLEDEIGKDNYVEAGFREAGVILPWMEPDWN